MAMTSDWKTDERLERLGRRLLAKWNEARQRGMTDEAEISAWVVDQLEDEFLLAGAPMVQMVMETATRPDEPDDDEHTRELRAIAQSIVAEAKANWNE